MLVSFFRTLLLYILVTIAMRIMGKKQVGQLEPVEFVIVLLLSELAAIPMQDMNLPLMHSIVPIASLIAFELLTSFITIKYRKTRDIIEGKPLILIRQGVIDVESLENARYNLDELMEEIRNAGYADIRDIEYAILENSGKMSIIPSIRSKAVTVEDLKIEGKPGAFPYVVISDGEIADDALALAGISKQQLEEYLISHKIKDIRNVFFAVLDSNKEFYYQLRRKANE